MSISSSTDEKSQESDNPCASSLSAQLPNATAFDYFPTAPTLLSLYMPTTEELVPASASQSYDPSDFFAYFTSQGVGGHNSDQQQSMWDLPTDGAVSSSYNFNSSFANLRHQWQQARLATDLQDFTYGYTPPTDSPGSGFSLPVASDFPSSELISSDNLISNTPHPPQNTKCIHSNERRVPSFSDDTQVPSSFRHEQL